jgi:predicted GIY-YIG superfamily endonuclease
MRWRPCESEEKEMKRGTKKLVSGTIYLIHFERPIGDLQNPHGYAQHYLGWTDDLSSRIEAHRSGNGSALMAAVNRAGIDWRVVRVWQGDRALERKLKNRKNAPKLCPICRQDHTEVME